MIKSSNPAQFRHINFFFSIMTFDEDFLVMNSDRLDAELTWMKRTLKVLAPMK